MAIGIVDDDVVPLMIGIVTVAVDSETVTVDNDELIGAPLLAFAANVWCMTGVTGCDITTLGCTGVLLILSFTDFPTKSFVVLDA